jgi:hypothetical protein
MASSFFTIAGSFPAGLAALWAAMEFGRFEARGAVSCRMALADGSQHQNWHASRSDA